MEGVDIYLSQKEEVPLILAFGGLSNQLSEPVFEFRNYLTKNFECHFIFVRDLEQVWYHAGVKDLTPKSEEDQILGTVATLKEEIAKIPYTRLVTLGTSAGGYASLLFGILLEVDYIVSFSPQTYLDIANRRKYGDTRWEAQTQKLHGLISMRTEPEKYLDLLTLDASQVKKIHLVLGTQDQLDRTHVERLLIWKNVSLEKVNAGHSCVKQLRDSGRLLKLLQDTLVDDLPDLSWSSVNDQSDWNVDSVSFGVESQMEKVT